MIGQQHEPNCGLGLRSKVAVVLESCHFAWERLRGTHYWLVMMNNSKFDSRLYPRVINWCCLVVFLSCMNDNNSVAIGYRLQELQGPGNGSQTRVIAEYSALMPSHSALVPSHSAWLGMTRHDSALVPCTWHHSALVPCTWHDSAPKCRVMPSTRPHLVALGRTWPPSAIACHK